MIIMVHAAASRSNIEDGVGTAEYSYLFAMREFFPVLERIGTLVQLAEPAKEADGVYEFCRQIGKAAVFLSFSPPHLIEHGEACPTIPVFPVEFHDLPTEPWGDRRAHDWGWVLKRFGQAITHSSHACDAVRRALGDGFPVTAIPSPVWDRFVPLRRQSGGDPNARTIELRFRGEVVDSRLYQSKPVATGNAMAASASFEWERPAHVDRHAPRSVMRDIAVAIGGVVYTSVFNQRDGRKNWQDIVRAFCRALGDRDDATLVLKVIYKNDLDFRYRVIRELGRLSPFACRVLVIDAFLDDQSYADLIRGSTYTVSASLAEGQCLPLMEAMSAGVPAVAPPHTAMRDYLRAANAFLVDSSLEPAAWPHDRRHKIRTTQHRIDARSLHEAFEASYQVATTNFDRYWSMADDATIALEHHCGQAVVEDRLRGALSRFSASTQEPTDGADARPASRPLVGHPS